MLLSRMDVSLPPFLSLETPTPQCVGYYHEARGIKEAGRGGESRQECIRISQLCAASSQLVRALSFSSPAGWSDGTLPFPAFRICIKRLEWAHTGKALTKENRIYSLSLPYI